MEFLLNFYLLNYIRKITNINIGFFKISMTLIIYGTSIKFTLIKIDIGFFKTSIKPILNLYIFSIESPLKLH
jgi:hypothetical protein